MVFVYPARSRRRRFDDSRKKRGKYDFLLLLVFEFFLLAWFVVPEGFNITFELSALLFYGMILSIPAIAAFILSGIAYLVIRNK